MADSDSDTEIQFNMQGQEGQGDVFRDVKGPVLLNGWTHSDIRQSQMEDADIGPILALLEEKKPRPKWTAIANQSSLFKTLWRNWDRLEVHCTILYRRWSEEDTISDTLQLIVPKSRRIEVIRLHHSIPSAAHLDAKRTMERIKTGFYWPGMKVAVIEFCQLMLIGMIYILRTLSLFPNL